MDYRDFNAVILPDPTPTGKGCSNTIVLLIVVGPVALFALWLLLSILQGPPIILPIGIILYLSTLLWVGATSSNDEAPITAPKPPIGTLLTLTDDYIAITTDTGVERFNLDRLDYLYFTPKSKNKFDKPAKNWYCKFKAEDTIYTAYLHVEYGQWETLAKKRGKLKERYNIAIW